MVHVVQTYSDDTADLLPLMSMFDKQGVPQWLLQRTNTELGFKDAPAPLLSFS